MLLFFSAWGLLTVQWHQQASACIASRRPDPDPHALPRCCTAAVPPRCLLYFMLVGESPFERVLGEAGGSLMLAVVK